jgi:hypothetical protein
VPVITRAHYQLALVALSLGLSTLDRLDQLRGCIRLPRARKRRVSKRGTPARWFGASL